MDKTWGINSEYQKIIRFKDSIDKGLNILEIGPGKGLLIDKIKYIYENHNVYAMQPKNYEYSEHNNFLKNKMGDNFIEMTLQDYIKTNNFIKFDIIYIYKININFAEKELFIKSLSEIINKDGQIYITSVEKDRFHQKSDECLWIKGEFEKYFDIKCFVRGVGNEYYGECFLKLK